MDSGHHGLTGLSVQVTVSGGDNLDTDTVTHLLRLMEVDSVREVVL